MATPVVRAPDARARYGRHADVGPTGGRRVDAIARARPARDRRRAAFGAIGGTAGGDAAGAGGGRHGRATVAGEAHGEARSSHASDERLARTRDPRARVRVRAEGR